MKTYDTKTEESNGIIAEIKSDALESKLALLIICLFILVASLTVLTAGYGSNDQFIITSIVSGYNRGDIDQSLNVILIKILHQKGLPEKTIFFIIKFFSILFSAISIWLAFKIGTRITNKPKVALFIPLMLLMSVKFLTGSLLIDGPALMVLVFSLMLNSFTRLIAQAKENIDYFNFMIIASGFMLFLVSNNSLALFYLLPIILIVTIIVFTLAFMESVATDYKKYVAISAILLPLTYLIVMINRSLIYKTYYATAVSYADLNKIRYLFLTLTSSLMVMPRNSLALPRLLYFLVLVTGYASLIGIILTITNRLVSGININFSSVGPSKQTFLLRFKRNQPDGSFSIEQKTVFLLLALMMALPFILGRTGEKFMIQMLSIPTSIALVSGLNYLRIKNFRVAFGFFVAVLLVSNLFFRF